MPSKKELEKSEHPINWLPQPLHGGQPDETLWSGKISARPEALKERLKLKTLEQYLESVKDYYYKVSPAAAVRCIDGRKKKTILGVKDRGELLTEELGPQAPGGSPVVALSHRIAEWNFLPWRDITEDVVYTTGLYQELGLPSPVGGHDDEHTEFPNTGCGAIDKMPEIIDRIADPRSRDVICNYVKAITGEDYSDELFESVLGKYKILSSPESKHIYLLQTPDGEYQYKNLTLEVLKDEDLTGESDNIDTMVGAHHEIALVINKIKGTTFHRDLFAFDSQDEAQIFNYDYWHSVERANAVYAHDPKQRATFLISRAMYAVGTCMVLTDGSLSVGIRE